MPAALAHVWGWFVELSGSRTNNGFGLNPLPYAEIAAWAALTRQEPTPWEVSLLRRLDAVALTTSQAKSKAGQDAPAAEIEPDDAAGMHTLLGGLRSRAAAVFRKT